MSVLIKNISLVKNFTIIYSYFFEKKIPKLVELRNGIKFHTNNILDLTVIIENFANESKYDYFLENLKLKKGVVLPNKRDKNWGFIYPQKNAHSQK